MLKSMEKDEDKLVELIAKTVAKTVANLCAKDPAEGGKGGGKGGERRKSEDAWAMCKVPKQEGTSSGSAEWKSGRWEIEDGEKIAEHKEDRKDWTNEWEEGMRGKSEIGRSKGYQGACWKCGKVGHKKGEFGTRNDGVVGRTGWTGGVGKGVGERREDGERENDGVVGRTGWTGGVGKGVGERHEVGEREKEDHKTRWEGGKVGYERWDKGTWNNEEESWGNKIRGHGVASEVCGKGRMVYEAEDDSTEEQSKDNVTGKVEECCEDEVTLEAGIGVNCWPVGEGNDVPKLYEEGRTWVHRTDGTMTEDFGKVRVKIEYMERFRWNGERIEGKISELDFHLVKVDRPVISMAWLMGNGNRIVLEKGPGKSFIEETGQGDRIMLKVRMGTLAVRLRALIRKGEVWGFRRQGKPEREGKGIL